MAALLQAGLSCGGAIFSTSTSPLCLVEFACMRNTRRQQPTADDDRGNNTGDRAENVLCIEKKERYDILDRDGTAYWRMRGRHSNMSTTNHFPEARRKSGVALG
ncbi:hypothetical protein TWF481_002211 [Arthrobotrys musiformis]|uniref:Uncharacterized protein n=1 Tax=Arthrobotrys musiformis TaxID=47236 RepID=A0AAV9VTR6_9PEZI